MARLILRDDDLNLNCIPSDLTPFFISSHLFDEVILSFVPFPCVDSSIGLCFDTLQKSGQVNYDFIAEVKKLLKRGNIKIGMHGVQHAGYGEFSKRIDIDNILRAKKYLENIFEVNVDIFTPPNNIISKENFINIEAAGFKRIITAFSNWPHERPFHIKNFLHFLLSAILVITKNKDKRILIELHHGGLVENQSFVAYTEDDLFKLYDAIKYSLEIKNGDIYIATHYWEVWKSTPFQLIDIIKKIKKYLI
ncbi:MAG: hypothetical protein RLY43_942 [Bacteroidota bacterium]|jgi:uncharacterized protein (DUF779 family)